MSGLVIDIERHKNSKYKTGIYVMAHFPGSGTVIKVDVGSLNKASLELYLAWPSNAYKLVLFMLGHTEDFVGYNGRTQI